MNRLLPALAVFLACALPALADRDVTPLREDWKFIKDDPGVAASSDSWGKISIPHTWNAKDAQEGPESISDIRETAETAETATKARDAAKVPSTDPHLRSGYYRGACWYEHSLVIPADWKGKRRVFIRFGAAGTVARTYINKMLLGEHRGGFTAFCYELTDHLNYGGANELRVQVDNSHREDLPPLSGDFNLDGGLYRDVELIVTDRLCISPLDDASPGVYLTTKSLKADKAVIEARTVLSATMNPARNPSINEAELAADSRESEPAVTLRTRILDRDGKCVASASSEAKVPAGETLSVSCTLPLSSPHLWQGRSDPYLYTVSVELLAGDRVIDEVTQPLGLRTVGISQEKGFLLNGKPYPVLGVNRHQDVRNKGWALSPQDEERDASLMKEMGVTAVRDAHYPQSANWHRINDREGVLLWDEVSLVNETRSSRAFWLNSEECLREMIHQLYNHPSIVWWGIFNELGNRPFPPSDKELAHLQAVAKELDPSRIVVAASNRLGRSFNHVPEQIGLNAYPGWYDRKPPSAMAGMIASLSKEVGKRIAVSEYGAGGNISHHTEGDPVQPAHKGAFHPEEWQAFVHEGDWAVMRDNRNLWGTFVWNMFDFAYQGRREGNTPALNDKGLVTHDRQFKKDAFFFYKANWNPEPMVHITSSRMTPRTAATTNVKVYSNCGEIELKVNGKPAATARPDSLRVCRFPDVVLSPGKNLIEAVGHADGKTVSDTCSWILEPGT